MGLRPLLLGIESGITAGGQQCSKINGKEYVKKAYFFAVFVGIVGCE
jgi:hypothetical protein